MNDKRFDDIIKNKLETLRANYAPETWEALSSKMEIDPELSDISLDQNFDQTVKTQLNSIRAEYNPETWDELAAKMELSSFEEEVIDEHFDSTLQSKLNTYSIPLSDNSWEILKERMEYEAYIRTQLYIAKATEVVIIFLLLFTVFRLLPSGNSQERNPDIDFAKVELEKDQLSSTSNPELLNSTEYLLHEVAENNLSVENGQIKETKSKTTLGNSPTDQHLIVEAVNDIQTPQELNKKVNEIVALNKITASLNQSPTTQREIAILADAFTPNDFLESNLQKSNQLAKYASLDKLDQIPAEGINYATDLFNSEINLIAFNKKPRTKIWLNGFISADAMLVNTPYDPVYDAPAFNKAAAGFSGGISVSAQRGSVELDAGLSYSSKGYQPQIIRELNGSLEANYVERALTNIIFDMAQANFNIKHHFYKNKKFQLYIMAGSTFNLITYSEYNFEEKPRSGNGEPLLTPIQTKLLDDKNFEDGALEGGGLISNSYFTLNAGIGLQHNISNKTAIFFQPNYQRHILDGGIGPNNDRIHNLSIQIGTKVLLN
jgi:hypothetical protein